MRLRRGHDFNNLLTVILGYCQLALLEAPPQGAISGHVEDIQKSAERASSLTNQLLTFSRHQVIEPKVVNLNELILDLDKMLRRLIGEDIDLITLPGSDLRAVELDPGQFEQVLINLAVNARDAMPQGGTLTIETATLQRIRKTQICPWAWRWTSRQYGRRSVITGPECPKRF